MTDNDRKSCGNLLLMAGGRHGRKGRGDPLLAAFIRDLGVDAPKAACIGAANDNDAYYYSIVKSELLASGAGEVFPAGPSEKKLIRKADFVFVSGGDVESGMNVLEKSGAIEFFMELFRSGMPFAGVSAGSIMLCRSWVRWSNPDDDSTAELFPCLGFADFICDTHDEDDDWSELGTAVAHSPDGTLGYGLPSGSGLRVAPDGTLRACGKNIAVFRSSNGNYLRSGDLKS